MAQALQENQAWGAAPIAAISTPQAPGGLGIIRISGAGAQQVADRVFRAKSGKRLADLEGYRALFGVVCDGDQVLDECVALNYREPASYTGENTVELSCHGGLYLLRRVLQAVLSAGARTAGPGEFTRRAFMNGKLGLTEAEAVMSLISAKGEQEARAAMAVHGGALEKRIHAVRQRLLDTVAHLEAWADYPEDEIPEVTEDGLLGTLEALEGEMKDLLAGFDEGKLLRDGVDTVIAGRPNVGKSTLMNLLAGCERSIVTELAGTTRDIVEETVLLGGIPLRLADTAGLRLTEDPVERIGVARARDRLASAQLILAVFDSSQNLDQEDRSLIAACKDVPAVAVINKTDLPSCFPEELLSEGFTERVHISAASGEGLPALRDAVERVLQLNHLEGDATVLLNERQRDAAAQAGECLSEALGALKRGMTFDAVTVSLEGAVSALLELTGERATTAVVDQVFSQFCVGK